jgi:hypothetical protein
MVDLPKPLHITLLTPERIFAASHICRWRGRVHRHYSVLEHSVIGAWVLRELGYDHNAVRSFLLHDLEETEFCGDIPTPDKAAYMNADYFADVRVWEDELYRETEVKRNIAVVSLMDEIMMRAEYASVVTFADDAPRTDSTIRFARCMIDADEFGTPEQWWQLWEGTAPVLFPNGVF